MVKEREAKHASMTMVSNTTAITEPVAAVLGQAKQKLRARAYLHWYQQHGVCEDKFHESFYALEEMLADYEACKDVNQ